MAVKNENGADDRQRAHEHYRREVHTCARYAIIISDGQKLTKKYLTNSLTILGGIASATPPIVTDAYSRVVRLSVRVYFTLVHPAKAVEWKEMPFGGDTRV